MHETQCLLEPDRYGLEGADTDFREFLKFQHQYKNI